MKKRILIVDDEVTFAAILSEYFEDHGYTVRTAHDGETALQEAKRFHPSVILTDIQMPKRSGYEWAGDLKKSNGKPLLFFMTAYDQYRDPELLKKCEADGYLQKPFKLDDLEEIIQKKLKSSDEKGGIFSWS